MTESDLVNQSFPEIPPPPSKFYQDSKLSLESQLSHQPTGPPQVPPLARNYGSQKHLRKPSSQTLSTL